MEGQLINGSTSLYGTIDLNKKSTSLTLPVGRQYVEKPIELTLDVVSGSATTPSTAITADPSISVSNTGKITATASASKNITPSVGAGWVTNGTAGAVTVSGSSEFQINSAVGSATISGGALPSSAAGSSNVVASATDTYNSGVSLSITSERTAVSAVTKVTSAGFAAQNNNFASASDSAESATHNFYVQGVTLTVPSAGASRQFDITVPNGNSTITFHFTVDSNGNTTITEV